MFRNDDTNEDAEYMWLVAREVYSQYQRVQNDISNRSIAKVEFENFLLQVVSHATAIRMAGKRTGHENGIPIEAVVIDEFYRNIFVESCVACGYTDHDEVAQIWQNCEEKIEKRMSR